MKVLLIIIYLNAAGQFTHVNDPVEISSWDACVNMANTIRTIPPSQEGVTRIAYCEKKEETKTY